MSALNLNKAIVCGRLTADVELKGTTKGTSVVFFTIAVNRPRARDSTEQKADFLHCIAWEKTAEFISKYFRKGDSIYIEGTLQTRQGKAGTGHYEIATEINVSEAKFVDNKQAAPAPPATTAPDAEPIEPDTDLPF